MAETLTVTVNGEQVKVPNTVSTTDEFLNEVGYEPSRYELYRLDGGNELQLNGMLVFDAGDEFVPIPKHATGGG